MNGKDLLQQHSRNEMLGREITIRRMREENGNIPLEILQQTEIDLIRIITKEEGLTKYAMTNELHKVGIRTLPCFEGKHSEEWKFDVVCLMRTGSYPDYTLSHVIRKYVKGNKRSFF
ncbi:hypothetical protein DPMN_163780 [Dreissena polymorpha]|uniref:Uncharacterized protein n=1 Tax=Dreissena polymorpha TaxID=45954 RepID=A0A9D4ETX6_DREPO|nr:hypothetical protein DPMN_163780 [Dreissena polymorpha]